MCKYKYLQLRVILYDSEKPDNKVETTVTVPVLRNVNTPKFGKDLYENTIYENAEVGMSILQMSATDDDKVTYNNKIQYKIPILCILYPVFF